MEGVSFFAALATMGALFWVAVVGGLILLAVLLEYEKVGWATTTTAAMFVGAYFWLDGFTLQWVLANSWSLVGALGAYLAVGIGWSFVKWYLFLKDKRVAYDDAKRDFLTERGLSPDGQIPPELVGDFREVLARLRIWDHKTNRVAPMARDHKERITTWIFWWPVSILNSLFADLARWIYNALRQEFQRISDRVFGDADAEIEVKR